jgi:hypothetical protein
MTLSTTEIEEERRSGRIAGAATTAAGLLLGVAIIWSGLINRDRPEGKNKQAEQLRYLHDHAGELIGVSVVRAVAFGLMVFTIVHLYRATQARNPELVSVSLVIGFFGVVALGIGSVVQAVSLADEAADFAGQSFPSLHAANEAAKDAAKEPLPLASGIVAFAGTIGLAFWFVMGSLNAMRVGLLTRFLGVLGIIVGPGFLFGFALPVMVFWLIAVGVLFLGRWPSGLPPAWQAGEAVPWPGRDALPPPDEVADVAPGSPNGEVDAVGPGVRQPDEQDPGQRILRRKRKRRT